MSLLLIKTSVLLNQSPTLITSFNLNYPPQDSFSKYCHIGLQHVNFVGHGSVHPSEGMVILSKKQINMPLLEIWVGKVQPVGSSWGCVMCPWGVPMLFSLLLHLKFSVIKKGS